MVKLTKEMMELKISEIQPNPEQPRKYFDVGKIKILADSIKEVGLDTPIQLLWKEKSDNGTKAVIKDGERRFRAMKLAGIKTLKYGQEFIYVSFVPEDLNFRALITFCMKEGLSPVEKAGAIRKLLKERGLEKLEVAISVINRAKDFTDNDFIAEPSSRNYYVPKERVVQIAKDLKIIGVSGTNAVELLKLLNLPKHIQGRVVFASPNSKIYKEKRINRLGNLTEASLMCDNIPLAFGYELARLKDAEL